MKLDHMLCAVIGAAVAFTAVSPAAAGERTPLLVASAKVAVAESEGGAVQGFVRDGITTFRGVPYATAARFEAPKKVPKWEGVHTALSYGNICPQPVNPALMEPQTFVSDTRFWPASENCQNLNIWTPALDGRKRPVMVWLHGGGFFSGSSMELPIYDGTNLSRKGDVVVVSINHRLNILGFLDLSRYDGDYAASGNLGMLDVVAALQWVRDNIASFGGDPANVTIFGQSGGGGKVATLLAAPSAEGLFQKAVIQSGVMGPPDGRATDQKISRRVTELVFKFAGLGDGDIKGLRALSYEQLSAAGMKALQQASSEIAPGAPGPLGFPRVNWAPVFDHAFLPERPYAGAAPAVSAKVPLLIGSTLSEFQLINTRLAGREHWDSGETTAFLRTSFGENSDQMISAFAKAYPAMKPYDYPTVDIGGRAGALAVAGMKAAQLAPVYNYLFAWRSPVLDYAWAAGHSSDIAFVFDNAALGVQSSGGGAEVDRLTDKISQAWINFARTGNPNHAGLPKWPAYTRSNPATMIFDTRSQVRVGHDAALIGLATQRPH